MAAWSPDQEDVGGFSHPKRVGDVPTDDIDGALAWRVSTPPATQKYPGGQMSDEYYDSCGYIDQSGNIIYPESPATPSKEPFPIEVWTFFSDSDLDQLVVDVCAEMGRRELEKNLDIINDWVRKP